MAKKKIKEMNPVGLFWDLDSVPATIFQALQETIAKIRNDFCVGHKEVKFVCVSKYHDKDENESRIFLKEKVTLLRISKDSQMDTARFLIAQIYTFADKYSPLATVVLLTDNVQMCAMLNFVKTEKELNVIVMTHDNLLAEFCPFSNKIVSINSLLAKFIKKPTKKSVKMKMITSNAEKELTIDYRTLLITNLLELGRRCTTVRDKLQTVLVTYQGIVCLVDRNTAVVKFKKSTRAKNAMAFLKKYKLQDTLVEVQYKTRKRKLFNNFMKKTQKKTNDKSGQCSLLNVPLKSNGSIDKSSSNSESGSMIGESSEILENRNTSLLTAEKTCSHVFSQYKIKKHNAKRKTCLEMESNIECLDENVLIDDVDSCSTTNDSPQNNQPRAIRAKQPSPLSMATHQPKSPSDGQQRMGPKFNNKTPTKKSPSTSQYPGTWRYSPRDGVPRHENSRVPKNLSFSFSYDNYEDNHHPSSYQSPLFQHQPAFRFDGRSFPHSPNPLPWRYVAPPNAFTFDNPNPPGRCFPNPYSSFYDQNFRKTPGASRPNSRNSTCSNYSSGSSGYGRSPVQALPTSVNVFQPVRSNVQSKVLTASDLSGGIPEEGSTTSEGTEPGTNPVELMVSNLDYNISAREWKKILFTEFQQQVQVLGVHIQTQPDNTSLAYVRLASIDEARYAISQFHRKKIGYKRIHVSLVDSMTGEQAPNVRSEITALLQEVSGNRLALFKFIEIYEKRFHRTISVSDLYRMRDLIEIQEMDGTGRMVVLITQSRSNRSSPTSVASDNEVTELLESPVCKVHCQPGSKWYVDALDSCCLPHVRLCLKHFAPQVHTMLQAHDGSMPIMSFPACYEVEFSQTLKIVAEGGVSLEHLVSCVPGVNVAVTKSGVKKVQWAENKPPSPIEWGKQCASPLLSNQLSQFSREVVDLLRQYTQCRMPFSKFIPSYHHHFGRQCRVADYGYTKLMELFEAIPHMVQIIGGGSRRYVTLSHRAQVKRFTSDLLRVLKSQSSKQISVLDLPIVYNKIVGKKFDITDYGICYLEDMLAEVPENTILVEGTGNDMVIALPRREQTPEEIERMKQFSLEVIDLLKNSPQCQMPFNKFIPAYHHHFGKQCRVSDYGFTKLIELFEAIPNVVDMVDQEGEKILVLTGPELLKVLEEHVGSLLKSTPGRLLPVPEFLAAYMRHHGHSLSLQDYGVSSVVQLIEKIPSVAKVVENEGRLTIALVDNTYVEQLARHVLIILMEGIEGKLTAPQIQQRHLEKFHCDLSIDDICILADQKNFIEVSIEDNENIVKLSSLQQFARDVRTLLRVHQGRLALNTFEAAFAQHFGVSLVPASYGYPSVVALLQAIPHMATIRGKGYRRTVLLSQDFQDKVPLSGSNAASPELGNYMDNPLHTPSNDSGVIESTDEDELLYQRARSPYEYLASGMNQSVPSPELHPDFRRSPMDLIRFEQNSPAYQDVLSMSGDKDGLQHPSCRTPVSEMLHLASQLLPPEQPQLTQQPSSTAFYSQPHLSCYGEPPVSYGSTAYGSYGYPAPSLSVAASLLPTIGCYNQSEPAIHGYSQSEMISHEGYMQPLCRAAEYRRHRCPIKIEKPEECGDHLDISGSQTSDTGSPNSQKQGTPRRSRLAARFNLPLRPSSVERKE